MILSRFSRSDCHQAAKALQSYLDGELPSEDAAMVTAHLEICHECGLEASAYLAIKTAIAATAAGAPTADRVAVDRLVRFARELSGPSQD